MSEDENRRYFVHDEDEEDFDGMSFDAPEDVEEDFDEEDDAPSFEVKEKPKKKTAGKSRRFSVKRPGAAGGGRRRRASDNDDDEKRGTVSGEEAAGHKESRAVYDEETAGEQESRDPYENEGAGSERHRPSFDDSPVSEKNRRRRKTRIAGGGGSLSSAFQNMNLPNKLTCLRMVLIVPFVLCMLLGRAEGVWRWFSLVIFCAASVTDTLDGYIARRDHLITDFGKFMDPLADKLLVISAMICLVDLDRMPAWILIVIIAREFAISGFRLIASDNGIVIAASIWGKAKTVSQMAAVILLIVNPAEGIWRTITLVVLYAALVLTVVSLVHYIYKNKQVLSMQK